MLGINKKLNNCMKLFVRIIDSNAAPTALPFYSSHLAVRCLFHLTLKWAMKLWLCFSPFTSSQSVKINKTLTKYYTCRDFYTWLRNPKVQELVCESNGICRIRSPIIKGKKSLLLQNIKEKRTLSSSYKICIDHYLITTFEHHLHDLAAQFRPVSSFQ